MEILNKKEFCMDYYKIGKVQAIALILMYMDFPIIPMFPWLKLDFSDVPALMGTFAFGPVVGVVIELIKNYFMILMLIKYRHQKLNLIIKKIEVLKVSAKSNPNSVAGALAGVMREAGGAEVQAIGAGALNQAVKAVAIARGFVAPGGIDLVCVPAFTDITIEGEERTAIKLIIEPR